ncbi:MAG: DNA-binding protein [Deltaproteobacteria bacterium]|nr:DNA-binding protein [Deltaproteobacteria bacterium]
MHIQEARLGRLFLLKFSHGEDLLQEISDFARLATIRAAWLLFLGALKQGRLVCGPEKAELPPIPVWQEYSQAWEVVGVGNLFWEGDTPRLHLHGALGKGQATLTGCLRQETEIYLVAEALVFELTGIEVHRRLDPALGVSLLEFS